jgi:hypothetical protein
VLLEEIFAVLVKSLRVGVTESRDGIRAPEQLRLGLRSARKEVETSYLSTGDKKVAQVQKKGLKKLIRTVSNHDDPAAA